MKVRRVDFYPDDWIAGTGDLSLDQRGLYVTACALIYSRGGPITRDHLRKQCPGHLRRFNAALAALVMLRKLVEEDGQIDQKRCERELEHAQKRVVTARKNGSMGGRPRRNTNDLAEPDGSFSTRARVEKPSPPSKERKELEVDLGRSAPPGRDAPSEADIAHVDRIVAETVRSGMLRRNGYGENGISKRDAWLNNLAKFVGQALDADARMIAWEAIEIARNAGSREATPRHVRRAVDDIDKLYRGQTGRMAQ